MEVHEGKTYNKHKLKVYAYIKAKRLIRKADKGFTAGRKFGGIEAQMMARQQRQADEEAEEEERQRKDQERHERLERNRAWRERREGGRRVLTRVERLKRMFSCTHCR